MARERFETLDGMRGVAALLVMLYHFYLQSQPPVLQNTFIAVDFFFILSGFIVMHVYGEKLAAGMPFGQYLAHRLARFYPLMASGLLIGAPVFALAARAGQAEYGRREIIVSTIDNLCFVPYLNDRTVFGATFNTTGKLFPADGPLWSIFFELAASIAFILLYRLTLRTLFRLCLAALALIVTGGLLTAFSTYSDALSTGFGWGTQNLLGGFPRVFYGFTCGMLLYQARARLGQRYFAGGRLATNLGCLLLYAALAIVLLYPQNFHGLYYLLAVTVLAPVLIMWGGEVQLTSQALSAVSRWLGWLSYPVYCLHTPVFNAVKLLDAKFALAARTGFSPQAFAIAGTLLLATLIGHVIDAPLRRWLKEKADRWFTPQPVLYAQPAFGMAHGFSDEE